MTRLRALRLLAVVLCIAPACSKNEVANPPPAADSGTASTETDTGARFDSAPSDSTALDGTSTDGDSDDGSATDGASTDSTTADTDPATDTGADVTVTAVCPKSFSDVTPTEVSHPGAVDDALLAALTWDELTMAWTTKSAGKVVIHYADRASRDAAFDSEFTLPDSLGPFAEDKVGLSADGSTMMFVSADHRTVRQVTRTARGTSFDASTATAAPFSNITGTSGEGGGVKQLGDLTLSKDGQWLLYTDLVVTTGSSMRLSTKLSDGTWDIPTPITATRLQIDAGKRRRPTGISSDKQALFFYDEVFGATFVAFRAGDSAVFGDFVAYAPSGTRATPSDACDRVYLDIMVRPDVPDGGLSDAAPDAVPPPTYRIVHAP